MSDMPEMSEFFSVEQLTAYSPLQLAADPALMDKYKKSLEQLQAVKDAAAPIVAPKNLLPIEKMQLFSGEQLAADSELLAAFKASAEYYRRTGKLDGGNNPNA